VNVSEDCHELRKLMRSVEGFFQERRLPAIVRIEECKPLGVGCTHTQVSGSTRSVTGGSKQTYPRIRHSQDMLGAIVG
jgi:hypothetical protein